MAVREKTVFGSEVYEAYVRGYAKYGKNYSGETVYFDGDVIYSYGRHFPMAVRMQDIDGHKWYLVNGDTYSVTTSKHQSDLRRELQYETTFTIPFSALRSAGIEYTDIVMLEQQDARYIDYKYRNPDTGEIEIRQRHLLGSAVFKVTSTVWVDDPESNVMRWVRVGSTWQDVPQSQVTETKYFLSGLDDTGRDQWNSYFLSCLPTEVSTVDEGFEALKPEEVKTAEEYGIEVVRQGEWFFVPVTDYRKESLTKLDKDFMKKKMPTPYVTDGGVSVEKDGLLPNRREDRENRHKATRLIKMGKQLYVRGTVRHTGGEHKMLKLDGWYEAFENTEVMSWVALGNID